MSIETDFQSYLDGNGLMAPNPVPPGTVRGSDNGPCFSSDYYIMKFRNGYVVENDDVEYQKLILSCTNSNDYLVRAPGDTDVGNPDDHYGVYAASVVLDAIPPFKFYWQLLRQPQLYFASRCAAQTPRWWKFWLWPLAIITSIVIATSCINDQTSDTDSRRLSWFLIQATKPYSLLCKWASAIWYKRLNKDYPNGLKDVYGIYYQPTNNNPYQKWVIE